MKKRFKEDHIANEKPDPTERSTLRFIYVPIVLISMFIGFGISYIALKTENTEMGLGDSRMTTSIIASETATAPQSNGSASVTPDLEQISRRGKQIFTTTCQACHQANGAGIPGAFPPLAGSEWVTGKPERLAAVILHGLQGEITVKGVKFTGVMPPFKDQLTHEDIASVATYIRQSWGNEAEPVTLELVKTIFEKTQEKSGPWNGQGELDAQGWN